MRLEFSTEGRLEKTYPGRFQPQPIIADIYADGTVSIGYNPEIGNSVTMDVWHGLTRRVRLHYVYNKTEAKKWYKSHKDTIKVLINGMGTKWDGNNTVGTLTEEAKEAYYQLQEEASIY